ncbi:MAG: DUF1592 domain-containing protein [Bryobacteraceae bacterium]
MISCAVMLHASPSEVVRQYCVGCHNERNSTAGINLNTGLSNVPANAEVWEKAIRKLRAGTMPPKGMPRPDRTILDGLTVFLETSIDAAAVTPDPGPSILRRLNRAEYGAAIRDILSLNVDVSALLPADDANHGFDNNADSLRVSPALLEGYLAASRKISRLAVGDPAVAPAFSTYRVRPDLGQDHYIEGLPLGTRGGVLVEHNFPLDGTYVFKTRLALNTSAKVRGLDFEHQFLVTVDGVRIHQAAVGGPADEEAAAVSPPASEVKILKRLEVRVPVSAGPHLVGVSFIRKTAAQEDGYLQPWLRSNLDTQEQRGIPLVESISIGGPFAVTGSGDTPSRRKIFVCRPTGSSDEIACAKKIIAAVARRAYRRPITEADLEAPLSFYQSGKGFEPGIENAIRFLLTSPEFLFRIERSAQPVSDLELASRLSFFLWSSVPDDELIQIAGQGKLKDPAILEKQVRRMLADSRSHALATNFAGQWLYLRNLSGVTRDTKLFPYFDDNLRQGFRQETEMFFDSIVREDHSALDLLRADYTFVNDRLARHYGIPNVRGNYFRRVTIPGEQRRGLLGQGSVLTVTSYATRTSPVLRGKWLLDNVLGTPVPPPPPNIPALAENHSGITPRSVRERMEEHRKNPACASCHDIMDPIGFSLENFDATGAWRFRSESNAPVDASGVLVDGTNVNGPAALTKALLDRPETFATTFTEKLMTYALGRGLEYYDMPSVRRVVHTSSGNDYRMSSILLGIVRSAPFQMKRTGNR